MLVVKPPQPISKIPFVKSIFLAGSIEMGVAPDWQNQLIGELCRLDVHYQIFNPRRDDWDSSWEQDKSNPQFNEQVNWELRALEQCDLMAVYFDPNTMAPISLLELGLYANTVKKLVVCCPDGFWRKGNVDIVCERYGVDMVDSLPDLCNYIISNLK